MAQSTLTNSLINLGLPSAVPEFFKDPQAKASVEMMLAAAANLLRGIEQYCGVTQKDITTWSSQQPTDTLLQYNLGRFYCMFSENVAFGALVNIHNVAGVANARNANSAPTVKPARGYCNVTGGVLAGAFGEVILSKGLMVLVGVVPGDSLYLTNTPGGIANAPDLVATHLEQFVGFGVATNLAYIDIVQGTYIQH